MKSWRVIKEGIDRRYEVEERRLLRELREGRTDTIVAEMRDYLVSMVPHQMDIVFEEGYDVIVKSDGRPVHMNFTSDRAQFLADLGKFEEALCYALLGKSANIFDRQYIANIASKLFKELAQRGEWHMIIEWAECMRFYGI